MITPEQAVEESLQALSYSLALLSSAYAEIERNGVDLSDLGNAVNAMVFAQDELKLHQGRQIEANKKATQQDNASVQVP